MFHGKHFWSTLVTRTSEEVRCASLTGLHVSDSVEGRRPAIDSIVWRALYVVNQRRDRWEYRPPEGQGTAQLADPARTLPRGRRVIGVERALFVRSCQEAPVAVEPQRAQVATRQPLVDKHEQGRGRQQLIAGALRGFRGLMTRTIGPTHRLRRSASWAADDGLTLCGVRRGDVRRRRLDVA
jgi:hypothetical protein